MLVVVVPNQLTNPPTDLWFLVNIILSLEHRYSLCGFRLYIKHHFRHLQVTQSVAIVHATDGLMN